MDDFRVDPDLFSAMQILTKVYAKLRVDENNETFLDYTYNIVASINSVFPRASYRPSFKLQKRTKSIHLDNIGFMLYEDEELIGKTVINNEYLKNEAIRVYKRYKRTHEFKKQNMTFWIETITRCNLQNSSWRAYQNKPVNNSCIIVNCKYKGYYASVVADAWFTEKHSKTINFGYTFKIRYNDEEKEWASSQIITIGIPENIMKAYNNIKSKSAMEQILRQSSILDTVANQIKDSINTHTEEMQQYDEDYEEFKEW
jgi:hypothetical protein